MVELATGQQMAQLFGVAPLTAAQILTATVARCSGRCGKTKRCWPTASPLWFYILREAEFSGGQLVGGRPDRRRGFHRAMEGSDPRSCATRAGGRTSPPAVSTRSR